MSIDELRDRAALAAFQCLLGKSVNSGDKNIDAGLLSVNAWEMAGRFIDQRPSASVKDALVKQLTSAPFEDRGAGPKPKSGDAK